MEEAEEVEEADEVRAGAPAAGVVNEAMLFCLGRSTISKLRFALGEEGRPSAVPNVSHSSSSKLFSLPHSKSLSFMACKPLDPPLDRLLVFGVGLGLSSEGRRVAPTLFAACSLVPLRNLEMAHMTTTNNTALPSIRCVLSDASLQDTPMKSALDLHVASTYTK